MSNFKAFMKQYHEQVILVGVCVIILLYLLGWMITAPPNVEYDEELSGLKDRIDQMLAQHQPVVPEKPDFVADLKDPYLNTPNIKFTGDPKWLAYRRPYVKFNFVEIQPDVVNAQTPEIESIENADDMLGEVRIKVKNNGTMPLPDKTRPGYIKMLTLHRRKKGESGDGEKVREVAKPPQDESIDITDSGLEENTEYEYMARVEAGLNKNAPNRVEKPGIMTANSSWISVKTRVNFHIFKFTMYMEGPPKVVYIRIRAWHPEYKKYITWESEGFKEGNHLKQTKPVWVRVDGGKQKEIKDMDTGYSLDKILDDRDNSSKLDYGIKCTRLSDGKVIIFWVTDKFGTGEELQEKGTGSSGSKEGDEEKESGEPSDESEKEEPKKEEPEKEEPEKKPGW
ncbi:MAG: hypothetical protein ACYS8W_11935 [Planctomycetota bacterium]|jgi:hypothetical protein